MSNARLSDLIQSADFRLVVEQMIERELLFYKFENEYLYVILLRHIIENE